MSKPRHTTAPTSRLVAGERPRQLPTVNKGPRWSRDDREHATHAAERARADMSDRRRDAFRYGSHHDTAEGS